VVPQTVWLTVCFRLHETEGPETKEKIQDEVRQWFISQKEQTGKFPMYPSVAEGGSAKIAALKAQSTEGSPANDAPKTASSSPGKTLRGGTAANGASTRKGYSSAGNSRPATAPNTPKVSPSRVATATGSRTFATTGTTKKSVGLGTAKRSLKVRQSTVLSDYLIRKNRLVKKKNLL
jgi:hypothetical protein